MSELQAAAVSWLTALLALLPLGYAFGAGVIAAVNPCGFAMLPAYLSIYLGADEGGRRAGPPGRRVRQAVVVGVSVSAGFLILFALVGMLVSAGGSVLMDLAPSFGALIGLLLIVLGLIFLTGRTLAPSIFERLAAGIAKPGDRSVRSFFLFGLAYGIASLGCTLPVFLVAVGGAMTSRGFTDGLVEFVSYGLGMASVVVGLTVAISLVKLGLVGMLRRLLPYVQTVAAALLVVAGVSIVLYWAPHLPLGL